MFEAIAKQYNLLLTKFYLPRRRPGEIQRPALLERLVERQPGLPPARLTLLTSPAGFGKTSLLTSMVEELALPVAWLSLDTGDNDPLRFWSYFIAALRVQLPGIGDHSLPLLHAQQGVNSIEIGLVSLLNELSLQTAPALLLILDDFHLIENPAIYNSLNYLLMRLPPGVRLVLAGRTQPKLALARLRANGELLELGLEDLRFSLEETGEFLAEKMALNLTNSEIATLFGATEGWITGLKLVALSLQTRLPKEYPAFFQKFNAVAGGHRYVADYLLEEAWESQPAAIQNFLLEISILEQFNAGLCATLTGLTETTCQTMLEEIERNGLFASSLDDAHNWFRQHRLFSDVLQHKLRQLRPEDFVRELHSRACRWYTEHELDFEAFRHAILAADYEQVTALVETRLIWLLDRGENNLLLSWLELLPPDLLQTQPALEMALVWALTLNGKYNEAAPHIRNLEQNLQSGQAADSSESGQVGLVYQMEILRAHLTRLQGNIAESLVQTQTLLAKIPPTDLFLQSLTLLNLGMLQGISGQTALAAATFAQTAILTQAGRYWYLTLLVLRLQTQQLRLSGQLRQMEQVLQTALKLVQQREQSRNLRLPFAGFAYLGMSELLYERNELAASSDFLAKGIELGQQGGSLDILLDAHVLGARLKFAQGEEEEVWRYLDEAERLAKLSGSSQLSAIVEMQKVYYQLRTGQLTEAAGWFGHNKPAADDEGNFLTEAKYMLRARFWLVKNRPYDALATLENLQNNYDFSQHAETLIKLRLLQAIAWQATGQHRADALYALEEALRLAAPEGFVRIFLDEGVALIGLLRQFFSQKKTDSSLPSGLSFGYLRRLLVNFGAELPTTPNYEAPRLSAPPVPTGSLLPAEVAEIVSTAPAMNLPISITTKIVNSPEELSERELAVLRLLAQGLSNQEIARQLTLGVNTVKTYLNNLYHKLDVHSRTQAIIRAKELHLV